MFVCNTFILGRVHSHSMPTYTGELEFPNRYIYILVYIRKSPICLDEPGWSKRKLGPVWASLITYWLTCVSDTFPLCPNCVQGNLLALFFHNQVSLQHRLKVYFPSFFGIQSLLSITCWGKDVGLTFWQMRNKHAHDINAGRNTNHLLIGWIIRYEKDDLSLANPSLRRWTFYLVYLLTCQFCLIFR